MLSTSFRKGDKALKMDLYNIRHIIGIVCRIIFLLIFVGVILCVVHVCWIGGQPYPEYLFLFDSIAIFCLGFGGLVTLRWPIFSEWLHPIRSTEPLNWHEKSKTNRFIDTFMNLFLIAFSGLGFWASFA